MASRWRARVRRAVDRARGSEAPPAVDPVAPVESSDPVAPAVDRARPRWAVGRPARRALDDGWTEVGADVDGEPMAFAVLGATPATRPEPFLTFVGPLALAAGADLVSEEPVDDGWRTGFGAAGRRLGPWVDADGVPSVEAGSAPAAVAAPAGGRVGLCFTGGVDSFWTLLRGGYDPTDLVYAWGFDVTLDDHDRIAELTASLEAVAAETGLGLRQVRTAARAHHLNAHLIWDYHHGAALAALGMLLSDELDELVIPPSYPDGGLIPWGSRPDLDPLWSIPGVVRVTHAATPHNRYQRIIDIADEPLVHRHLRVCWEYLEPGANCGRCEKCVRTMVMFAGAGALDRLETFPGTDDLPSAVAALAPLPPHSITFWEALVDDRVPPPLRHAVEELIEASR